MVYTHTLKAGTELCASDIDTLLVRFDVRRDEVDETASWEKNPFVVLLVGEYIGLKADSEELPCSDELE